MRDPLCSFAMRYKSEGMRCETLSCCGTNERACWDVRKEVPSWLGRCVHYSHFR